MLLVFLNEQLVVLLYHHYDSDPMRMVLKVERKQRYRASKLWLKRKEFEQVDDSM